MNHILAAVVALMVIANPEGLEFKVTPSVANTLNFLHSNLTVEFAFCGYGHKKGNIVTLNQVYLPVIIQATETSIVYNYENCPTKNLLGVGHSHPGESPCLYSGIDIHTLITTPFKYGFLACKGQMRAYVKAEVRRQLIEMGLLPQMLRPPFLPGGQP